MSPRSLSLPHGEIALPAFLPDATLGVVRSVDSADLQTCGVPALMMNVFHLMQRPGSSTIQALGGLHSMAAWDRPIMTDSGGFQAYSLIRRGPRLGKLSDRGISFQPEGAARKFTLTAEKTIQLQLSYGADIAVCLDDCTHVDDPPEVQEQSVRRTVDWARRCKNEFERILAQKKQTGDRRPMLFAVIQGGGSRDLRKRCAEALLEIGFDGYGYGGWPLDSEGNLLLDIISYTRELVPREFPMHALGVGYPPYVERCVEVGYDMLDASLPTRDARHGRLYAFTTEACLEGDWFSTVYIQDAKWIKSDQPVFPSCDCLCCTQYSVGYLHHLFDINDCLSQRLATIHNLRFMSLLIERLRGTR